MCGTVHKLHSCIIQSSSPFLPVRSQHKTRDAAALLLSEAQYRRGAVPLSGMKGMAYRHEYCRTPVQDLQSLRSRI
jgi:hypothetical protein